MHLYWVQTGGFWQQEAAGCPAWEEAACCPRQLRCLWKWPHTNAAARGAHTSAHPCLTASSSCQGKEAQKEKKKKRKSRDMGKGMWKGTLWGTWLEMHSWEEPCRREGILRDHGPQDNPHHNKDTPRDWPAPGQGPHINKIKWYADLTLTTCISTPYISSHLALFK